MRPLEFSSVPSISNAINIRSFPRFHFKFGGASPPVKLFPNYNTKTRKTTSHLFSLSVRRRTGECRSLHSPLAKMRAEACNSGVVGGQTTSRATRLIAFLLSERQGEWLPFHHPTSHARFSSARSTYAPFGRYEAPFLPRRDRCESFRLSVRPAPSSRRRKNQLL